MDLIKEFNEFGNSFSFSFDKKIKTYDGKRKWA